MSRWILALGLNTLAAACSCAQEPAGPVTRLQLLARRPDFVLQQTGALQIGRAHV